MHRPRARMAVSWRDEFVFQSIVAALSTGVRGLTRKSADGAYLPGKVALDGPVRLILAPTIRVSSAANVISWFQRILNVRLATTESRGVLIVTIGEPRLDRTNRDRFKQALAAHLRPGVKIALGLEGVRYVDGPGCGTLLSLHKKTAELGGEMKIFSLHAPVRSLFQKLHLHKRVHTFNRREEVMQAFFNGD